MRRISRISLAALLVSGWNPPAAGEPRAVDARGRRPLAFEENRGQTDGQVSFLARAPGYNLFLTPSEAVVAPAGRGPSLRLRWLGVRPGPAITGEGELPGRTHYLTGNDPARWRTGIASFERVRYREVYRGIDLVFHGDPRQLEYDFVVSPGADPGAIRLAVEGADRLEIDTAGDLVLRAAEGELRLRRPVSYQEIGGVRREVASRWRRLRDGSLGFAVGRYDRRRPLVIDPVVVYSTYLGGSDGDRGEAIAVDPRGNAYVTGATGSPDFPVRGSAPPSENPYDAFVTKLDPSGALVWSTYLGGRSSIEEGHSIAVDAAGHVYVTGETASVDFPLVNPLPARFLGEGADVFVSKLHPSGAALVYSTRLGGYDLDIGYGIAIDPQGRAYVGGLTFSPDFPAVRSLLPFGEGFVARLSAGGSQLQYSSRLGDDSIVKGVAVDNSGHAFVVGSTSNPDLPGVAPGSYRDAGDVFLMKLHPTGEELAYAVLVGGEGSDSGQAVAVDAGGNAWVAGTTQSGDFPSVRAVQAWGGQDDAFVTRLDPAGTITFSTHFGGSGEDLGWDLAIDGAGGVYLTGEADSPDFPRRGTSPLECGAGCLDTAFVAHLDADRSELVYSVLLRGAKDDLRKDANYTLSSGRGIAVGPRGDACATGWTTEPNFLTVNAFDPFLSGREDAFVVRIVSSVNRPPDCSAAAARPDRLWPPNGKLRPLAVRGMTDPDGDPVSLTVTSIRQDEPLSKKGSPDALGVGTATPQVRADRAGGGDGRVYHLSFTASDGQGGACTGEVTVCVPHDQRGRTCGDGGALIDSTGPGS